MPNLYAKRYPVDTIPQTSSDLIEWAKNAAQYDKFTSRKKQTVIRNSYEIKVDLIRETLLEELINDKNKFSILLSNIVHSPIEFETILSAFTPEIEDIILNYIPLGNEFVDDFRQSILAKHFNAALTTHQIDSIEIFANENRSELVKEQDPALTGLLIACCGQYPEFAKLLNTIVENYSQQQIDAYTTKNPFDNLDDPLEIYENDLASPLSPEPQKAIDELFKEETALFFKPLMRIDNIPTLPQQAPPKRARISPHNTALLNHTQQKPVVEQEQTFLERLQAAAASGWTR